MGDFRHGHQSEGFGHDVRRGHSRHVEELRRRHDLESLLGRTPHVLRIRCCRSGSLSRCAVDRVRRQRRRSVSQHGRRAALAGTGDASVGGLSLRVD